ncbi:hypothetical protein, partial [Paenibacillus foliorum]|uniref:hypothetical protein n=1 Tax=Paenibacillus foliorum TaxID=2654974 RepID=UPI001C110FD5
KAQSKAKTMDRAKTTEKEKGWNKCNVCSRNASSPQEMERFWLRSIQSTASRGGDLRIYLAAAQW